MTPLAQQVIDMTSGAWFFDKGDRLILNVDFHPPGREAVALHYLDGPVGVKFLHDDLQRLLPNERELEPGELEDILGVWGMIANDLPVQVDPVVYWSMRKRSKS